jgi:hypothetical protein
MHSDKCLFLHDHQEKPFQLSNSGRVSTDLQRNAQWQVSIFARPSRKPISAQQFRSCFDWSTAQCTVTSVYFCTTIKKNHFSSVIQIVFRLIYSAMHSDKCLFLHDHQEKPFQLSNSGRVSTDLQRNAQWQVSIFARPSRKTISAQ